jgi:hypothetical protein
MQRASGSSTEHHQSSRSHAILRLEVVTPAMQACYDDILTLQAQVPALKNAVDNAMAQTYTLKYSGYKQVLRMVADDCSEDPRMPSPPKEGDYDVEKVTHEQGWYVLKCVGDGVARSLRGWERYLGMAEDGAHLQCRYVHLMREYPGGEAEREACIAANNLELERSRALRDQKQAELFRAEARLEQIMASGSVALGGSMLLVDLAGADYDHRKGGAQKESAAINKSLLTLKECFRSLSNVSSQRPPFRDSKLTRLLQDSLAPNKASKRRNKEDSECVMVVNVSPATELSTKTINSLRYGQIMSQGRGRGGVGGNTGGALRRQKFGSGIGAGGGARSKMSQMRQEKLRDALRAVYKEFVPEKSAAEVEAILGRFKGREAGLLKRVREKYADNGVAGGMMVSEEGTKHARPHTRK